MMGIVKILDCRFNTQPPEGGWHAIPSTLCSWTFQHTAARRRLANWNSWCYCRCSRFNTQPPEGGCYRCFAWKDRYWKVSTQNAANLVLLILNVGFSFLNYAFWAVFLCNKIKYRKIFAEHIIIIRESVRKNLLLWLKLLDELSSRQANSQER